MNRALRVHYPPSEIFAARANAAYRTAQLTSSAVTFPSAIDESKIRDLFYSYELPTEFGKTLDLAGGSVNQIGIGLWYGAFSKPVHEKIPE